VHVYLYMDDHDHGGSNASSTRDDGSQVLRALSRQPNVTILSMQKLGLHTQAQQIRHCHGLGTKKSVWMANWDVDESPALGAPPSNAQLATDDTSGASGGGALPSIPSLLRALPAHTAGVLVPRLVFDCAARTTALDRESIAMEAYDRRACDQSLHGGGKCIWRCDSVGQKEHVHPNGAHNLFASRRSALRAPDGAATVAAWVDQSNANGTSAGGYGGAGLPTLNATSFTLTASATAMRLHHYASRSRAECERKSTDQAKGQSFFGADWRSNADWYCPSLCSDASPALTTSFCPESRADRSIAQHVGALRERRDELGKASAAPHATKPRAKAEKPHASESAVSQR
jgi:hypothetical protein